jgi:hypothetical protein
MKRVLASLAALAVLAGAFAWSARAGDGKSVEERLASIEQRLAAVETKLRIDPPKSGTAPNPPPPAVPPPAVEPPKPPVEQPKEVTVYVTTTGKKYHRAGCQYLAKSSIPMKLADAKAQGYTPCSKCGPP